MFVGSILIGLYPGLRSIPGRTEYEVKAVLFRVTNARRSVKSGGSQLAYTRLKGEQFVTSKSAAAPRTRALATLVLALCVG